MCIPVKVDFLETSPPLNCLDRTVQNCAYTLHPSPPFYLRTQPRQEDFGLANTYARQPTCKKKLTV